MKIAVWHNLPSGGGFRALFDQVRGLVRGGHQVEIWCPESAERILLPIDQVAKVHRLPLSAAGHSVLRNDAFRLAWQRYKTVQHALRALENHVRQCAEEIQQGEFDVILAHPSRLFYMHPLARFTQIPSVLYLQEIYRCIHEARPALPWEALPDPVRRYGSPSYWRWFAINLLDTQTDRMVMREERKAAMEWDAILCNSFFSRETIVRAYGIDARVCYLGIDTSSFSPTTGVRSNYLLGLGGLDINKCVHLAIEALGQLPMKGRPALKWVCNYTNSQYQQQCEALARHLGVDFVCETRLPEEFLRIRLQQALALVYPSCLEPFGYAPLEANACGTPVIAIAEGGIRETVQDGVNGLLIENRQPVNWAAAISRLITEPGLQEKLARQSIAWVGQKWTVDAAAARLERELESVVSKGKRNNSAESVMKVPAL
ncbi:MAG: glycosyltransferase family 4 protein [bacterium]